MRKEELEKENKALKQQLALIHRIAMEISDLSDKENVARLLGKIDYYSESKNITIKTEAHSAEKF
jgi:chaperonin cofactor prefoldin